MRDTGNLLYPKIKIWILICCPYSFPTEVVGEVDKVSSKAISCDHVQFYKALILQGEIWC